MEVGGRAASGTAAEEPEAAEVMNDRSGAPMRPGVRMRRSEWVTI